MNQRLYGVIVLYNKKIYDSVTVQTLKEEAPFNLSIIIVDNSTDEEIKRNNELVSKTENIEYIDMIGNVGLSKAYNRAIDYLLIYKQIEVDSSIVIWLDDDTILTYEYFTKLEEAKNQNPLCDIFAPFIIDRDGKIWSPNKAGFLKNKLIEAKTDKITNGEFNAINSCTAARLSIYKNYRYDERLFLDQVDHKFYYDQQQLGRKFFVLKSVIMQNFSQMEDKLDPDKLWIRLQIRLKDIMVYGRLRGNIKFLLLAYVKCCGICVSLGIKAKSAATIVKAIGLSTKYLFMNNEA